MTIFIEKIAASLLVVVLLVASLVNSIDALAVDFGPFGSVEETDTPLSSSDVMDEGPVIPEIQFNNNDISMAFQIISDATGWSIFPTVEVSRAKVSLWAKDVTAKELLDTVVTLAGFIYHRQGDVISVMTYNEYMQYHGLAKKVIPLTYADGTSVAAVIKPFLTRLGKTVVHKETNTIVLYEADANLEFIASIMEKLDTPAENISVEVINLRYADCDSLAAILQQVFVSQKKMAKNRSLGATDATTPARTKDTKLTETRNTKDVLVPYEEVGIYAVSHANQLIIVGTQSDIRKVKDVVAMIDVYGDNTVFEVIELKYADAEMVAKTLQEIFSSKESKNNVKNRHEGKRPLEQVSRQREGERGVEIKGLLLAPQADVGVYCIGRTNQLIIKAFRTDIEKLKKLVEKLDVFIEPTTKNYHFTYVDASEVHKGLETILNIYSQYGGSYRQSGQAGGRGYRSGSGITLVERTNSILLTGPPSAHRIMTSICQSIDVPGRYEAGMIRVYKIENSDVEEIANTIRVLIESKGEQKDKPVEPKFEEPAKGVPKPGPAELAETEEFVPQIQAKVSVNKATNSVVVLATARQHRELEKLIEQLDVRRKQVLIEAMIVEVTTNDNMDFGVELDYIDGDLLAFTSFGLSSIDPATGVRNVLVSPGGTAAVLRPNKVQAILKALQTNDNVRIESAPQILVNDNAVGTIQSVAEEPTRKTIMGETTTETSFGEYVSAGTQFAITPHISESNYLRVVYQITLNFFGEKADPTLPPARNTSTIQSEATVPDGSTIVVGGIQTSSESESVDKVPILGDIPLVGLAFRNTAIRKQYITTYLFITTTIMKSEDFGDLKDLSKKALQEVKEDASNQTAGPEIKDVK